MQIEVTKGDITTFAVDAIVNAANTSLLGGGGVDGAIHRAAGPELLAYCRTLGGCKTGEAKITPGFGLPARYVIHTPGPIWQGGHAEEDRLLASCYHSCLSLAAANHCRTVAFPSISTGVYHFPLERAAAIAMREISAFEGIPSPVERVILVCFDDRTFTAYQQALHHLKGDVTR